MDLTQRLTGSLAPPALILLLLLAAVIGLSGPWLGSAGQAVAPPVTVVVPPHAASYRVAGEFWRAGVPVDAPLRDNRRATPLLIMALQVSAGDYARCVAAGPCKPAADPAAATLPVTGASFADANAYAGWLSRVTGQFWRLPTDAEWSFAAGSRFADDALGLAADPGDPSKRWRAAYARESAGGGDRIGKVQPAGHFGRNEFGVADLAGSVWEWTSTCYDRTRLDGDGTLQGVTENCNVRVAEGRHRAYLTAFIRDARGGGCAQGRPPDHLGFRLVRDASPLPLVERLAAWWAYR